MSQRGKIEYTERAYEQDAGQAMKGDIVRALIELITNADDAYRKNNGAIQITVQRAEREDELDSIAVSDTAIGLTSTEMRACFATLAGQTSGFAEGEAVRGFFGRGAKDTAVFGRTEFDAVRDGKYSRFVLNRDLTWELDPEDVVPTEEQLAAMGLAPGENGLTARIVVRAGTDIPTFQKLLDRLSSTAQLRFLTTSRRVTLEDRIASGPIVRGVKYSQPAGELVITEEYPVPGYDGILATFEITRMNIRVDGRVKDESDHGLLVVGKRAVYDNTLFGLDSQLHAGWFCGMLRCEHIDDLVRSYDEHRGDKNIDETNPIRIVDRNRDGLVRGHPFTRALETLTARVLGPLIDAEQRKEDQGRTVGDRLKKQLSSVARDLSRLLREDLNSIEDEQDGNEGPSNDLGAIRLIPPVLRLPPGVTRSITVVVRGDLFDDFGVINATSSDPSIIEIVAVPDALEDHKRIVGYRVGQLRVVAKTEGTATISATCGNNGAVSLLTVVNDLIPPPNPPEIFRFAREQVTATRTKRRSVEIIAPVSAANTSDEVTLSVEGTCVELETDTVTLKLNHDGWFSGKVFFTGTKAGEQAKLIADLGKHRAVCVVRVVDPGDPTTLGIELNLVDVASREARGQVVDVPTGIRIDIFARHPALVVVLGQHRASGWENEQDPKARLVLAEVIAGELSDWVVERDASKHPERFTDPSTVLSARRRRLSSYLPIAQRLAT